VLATCVLASMLRAMLCVLDARRSMSSRACLHALCCVMLQKVFGHAGVSTRARMLVCFTKHKKQLARTRPPALLQP
jgi:hypothetical protein